MFVPPPSAEMNPTEFLFSNWKHKADMMVKGRELSERVIKMSLSPHSKKSHPFLSGAWCTMWLRKCTQRCTMVTPSEGDSETCSQQNCLLEERQLTFTKSIGHWFSVSTHSPSQTSCFFLLLASFLHLWKQKNSKPKAAQSELKKKVMG